MHPELGLLNLTPSTFGTKEFFIVEGAVLCIVRRLAASLASNHWVSVAPPSSHLSCDNQKHLQILPKCQGRRYKIAPLVRTILIRKKQFQLNIGVVRGVHGCENSVCLQGLSCSPAGFCGLPGKSQREMELQKEPKGSLYRKYDYEGALGAPARAPGEWMWQCWHSGGCTSSLCGINKCQQLWLLSEAVHWHHRADAWAVWKLKLYLSICETSLQIPRKPGRAQQAGHFTTEGDREREREGKLCFYIIRCSCF